VNARFLGRRIADMEATIVQQLATRGVADEPT
jgi:hypothetical protein